MADDPRLTLRPLLLCRQGGTTRSASTTASFEGQGSQTHPPSCFVCAPQAGCGRHRLNALHHLRIESLINSAHCRRAICDQPFLIPWFAGVSQSVATRWLVSPQRPLPEIMLSASTSSTAPINGGDYYDMTCLRRKRLIGSAAPRSPRINVETANAHARLF